MPTRLAGRFGKLGLRSFAYVGLFASTSAIGLLIPQRLERSAPTKAVALPGAKKAEGCLYMMSDSPTPELAASAGFRGVEDAATFLRTKSDQLKAVRDALRAPMRERFRAFTSCVAEVEGATALRQMRLSWSLAASSSKVEASDFRILDVQGLSREDERVVRCFGEAFDRPVTAPSATAPQGFVFHAPFPVAARYSL